MKLLISRYMRITSRIRKFILRFLGLNIDEDYARKIELGGGVKLEQMSISLDVPLICSAPK